MKIDFQKICLQLNPEIMSALIQLQNKGFCFISSLDLTLFNFEDAVNLSETIHLIK